MDKQLFDRLSEILPKSNIRISDLYRDVYARDASYFEIRPEVIVRPDSPSEVEKILALATELNVNITFRAAGTSLSGQSLGDGIICELRTSWREAEVRDNGNKIWFEPGLTCAEINKMLRKYDRKIGPDPASFVAAMMGGILSNNSSGMQAGVKHNSYHTLNSIEFILSNGNRYTSSNESDRQRFETQESELCSELMACRTELMANQAMKSRVIDKYKIKNVTGYGMNSFVDFDNPMDIFTHLLIGSEGTLAFIVSAELNTIPLLPIYSSSMLYFSNATLAAASVPMLGDSGALSIEMMDYAAIMSSSGALKLPEGTTAMLIDYGASSGEQMQDIIERLTPQMARLDGIIQISDFTKTVSARDALWQIRDGIFPCVAGARIPGDTVILEDVVAPLDRLHLLVGGLQGIFRKHNYTGSIFGHARDGDLHPLVTSAMNTSKERDTFSRFMDDMVSLVLSLDGSLKGEHGTGRAVAPFVEREWGAEIYSIMKRVKAIADPNNILNRGVIINSDTEVHLQNIKDMSLFAGDEFNYKKADNCIECGFCEHVCPSRNVTFTPRQRIQAKRVLKRRADKILRAEYTYPGEQTCAADGMCQKPCPMGINTAVITDGVRARTVDKSLLYDVAEHFGTVESNLRATLKLAVAAERVVSPYPFIWATHFLNRMYKGVPNWSKFFPMPHKLMFQEVDNAEFIYFPSCVTRIFGSSDLGKDDMISVVLRVANRVGVRVTLPEESHGLCCSQIWEHKGSIEGQRLMANRVIGSMYIWSDSGRIPIFCDTTSCTHTLLREMGENILTPESLEMYNKLQIIDITEWLDKYIIPCIKKINKKRKVLLHPSCACDIMGLTPIMQHIAEQCAEDVVIPDNWGCCGASGDRGFVFPELSESATRSEHKEVSNQIFDGCYSLARTCEISMQEHIDKPYESIIYLVDEVMV